MRKLSLTHYLLFAIVALLCFACQQLRTISIRLQSIDGHVDTIDAYMPGKPPAF